MFGTRRHAPQFPWFRPILHRQLGLAGDNHIDALKAHVKDAGLMPADGRLDLVIIESLEHYEELLQGGVPMAQIDSLADSPPAGRVVRLPLWRYRLLLLGVAFMPSVWMWPTRLHQFAHVLHRLL